MMVSFVNDAIINGCPRRKVVLVFVQNVRVPGGMFPRKRERGSCMPRATKHFINRNGRKSLNAVDLFAGAGGITLGLDRAGFRIVLANDIDHWASSAHRRNHPEVPFVERDITKISAKTFKELCNSHKIHLVSGGPPCQGFSMTGARRPGDARNELFKHYIRILKSLNPNFFFMENVKGLLSMKTKEGEKIIDRMMKSFRTLKGYIVDYRVFNFADYGVPQTRERVIFIGNRMGYTFSETVPPQTHSKEPNMTLNGKGLERWVKVGETIMDLAGKPSGYLPNHAIMNHSKTVRERMSLIPEGEMIPKKFPKGKEHLKKKSFQTIYQRLARNKPAPTIVPGHMAFPIHPTKNRSLTVREAARLQTFPDNFEFFGPGISQGLQAGNAVPPVFAYRLGLHIKKLMLKKMKP